MTDEPDITQLVLRSATLDDAALLLEWRNDPETRSASRNSDPIDAEDHIGWLQRSLDNDARSLLIAAANGRPVGTVRADLTGSTWELSWSVAPSMRGQGFAKHMVALAAQQIPAALQADVKCGNIASTRVAEFAGLTLQGESDGMLHYVRAAIDD
jgi:RimJ/RimL family protein N-acetyltransferase